MTTEVWVWIGVVGLGAAVAGFVWYIERRRRLALEEEARGLGFTFQEEAVLPFSHLPHALFSRGRARLARNLMEGSYAGLRARLFDYQYTVGTGRNQTTYRQSVAAFQAEQSSLPIFELFPERFYHAFAEIVGFKDIDFPDDPGFSDNYRLLGQDEAAVRRCFNPVVVSALAARRGWTVEGAHQTLLVYRPQVRVSPREIQAFLAEAREIARAFQLR